MGLPTGCEGIIEDVILLGTPATGDPAIWARFKKVVSGKIVNGFCRGDWLLKFLYRTSSVQMSIAGLRPVDWDDRRMHNIDLSDVVTGHLDYRNSLDVIMKAVGIRTKDELSHSPSGSSSKASSSKDSPVSDEFDVDELSSSDDEMFEDWKKSKAKKNTQTAATTTSDKPVVLEDYTSQLMTGSVVSEEDPTIPESTSFDSGVVINRAASEARDQQAKEDLHWSDDHNEVTQGAADLKDRTVALDSISSVSDIGDKERWDSEFETDRIGDAAAAGESENDDDLTDTQLMSSVNEDEEEKSSIAHVSNLERKKMYDSMYRLVMDEDLEAMLGEDDDCEV